MARKGKVVDNTEIQLPKAQKELVGLESLRGNRFPTEPPREEVTQVYSIHDAMAVLHDLTLRLDATDKLLNLFILQGTNPVFKGHRLARCKCLHFVTKAFMVKNPHAGDVPFFTCGKCPVDHPHTKVATTTVHEIPYATPEVISFATELNERLEKAYK